MAVNEKLTLGDIVDLRAYERERDAFRTRIIDIKRARRVSVGPIITLVFENRDTIRFQIQEMARAERMLSDEQIQGELDAYNPLIPDAGELSATLFIELTAKDQLMQWLPKLVGIEQSVQVEFGASVVRCEAEEAHAEQLARDDITASVHYVRFRFTPSQVEEFAAAPTVVLAVDHPSYQERTELTEAARQALLADLRG